MIFEMLFIIGLMALAVLTVAAIIDVVLEHMEEATSIEIIDPAISEELERIAAEKGSTKRHKRFAYDRTSRKAVLVESNRVADELADADHVTIDLR
jgi:hypothetical protein